MSTKRKKVNRKELRVMILRNYGNIMKFCEQFDINYHTFKHYLSGNDRDYRLLNKKIVGLMVENGYHPYKEVKPKLTKLEKEQILVEVGA